MRNDEKFVLNVRYDKSKHSYQSGYDEIYPVTMDTVKDKLVEHILGNASLTDEFKEYFEKALNQDEENIEIGGYTYNPVDVLLNCKPTNDDSGNSPYIDMFIDWLNSYVEHEILPALPDYREKVGVDSDLLMWSRGNIRIWSDPYIWYVVRVDDKSFTHIYEHPFTDLDVAMKTAEKIHKTLTKAQRDTYEGGEGTFEVIEVLRNYFEDPYLSGNILDTHWNIHHE